MTPDLKPLTPGRWQFSKKRQAEIMARYLGLKAEWSELIEMPWSIRANYEAWLAVDREIASLEMMLVRQAIHIKNRKSSARRRPVERRPGARP
ncbi:MAG: hypothetical protein WD473_11980 [Acidimicrobiia bacterium]